MGEMRWRAFAPRQLTGKPYVYHGYVGHDRVEELCCTRDHRYPGTAVKCAERAARRRNRVAHSAVDQP